MRRYPQTSVSICSRNFDSQVGLLEQDSFLPTDTVGYLYHLMSNLGISKCLENSAFKQMQLSPQNLVVTCSCNFDFKWDD